MEPPQPAAGPARPPAGESFLLSLISAGLFLYVGFGLGLTGISESAVYNGSVTALVWGARGIGIGLLVALGLTYLRVPGVALLDFVLAGLATVGCLIIGVIWLVYSDIQGVLLLLFGLLNASAARQAWSGWLATRHATPAPRQERP
jgi:hypothetical protein